MSRPVIHPLNVGELPSPLHAGNVPPGVNHFPGTAGTPIGAFLRASQFACSLAALLIMATTNKFWSVTAFRFLVGVTTFQSMWSFGLAFVDIRAISIKRKYCNRPALTFFVCGDMIFSVLIFVAGSASAGAIVVMNQWKHCPMRHCPRFEVSTTLVYLTFFLYFTFSSAQPLVLGFPAPNTMIPVILAASSCIGA